MSFLPMIALAVVAFLAAAFVLRLPRTAWALFGAALLFGLAGYAIQGSPDEPGAPKAAVDDTSGSGAALVEARRALFDPSVPPAPFVTVADGFARRGQYADAAGMLRGALDRDPNDAEAWLALGNALVEHAEGQATPAAMYAYDRAQKLAPGNPGPGFFVGLALIRSGKVGEARDIWADLLAHAPANAPWRAEMQERLDRLDVLIGQMGGQ
jgi:cytochrome c-type biogenesis protein CcmH